MRVVFSERHRSELVVLADGLSGNASKPEFGIDMNGVRPIRRRRQGIDTAKGDGGLGEGFGCPAVVLNLDSPAEE